MPSRLDRRRKARSGDVQWVNGRVVLKKHKLEALRKNRDFITAIRIGRVMNALMFSGDLISDEYNWKKSVDRRKWHRSFQINVGYLYETLQVFGSIRSRYASEPFFAKAKALSDISTTPETKAWKNLIAVIRHAGFHLDQDDKMTSKIVEKMEPSDYIMISSDDGTLGTFHFDLADEVDGLFALEEYRQSASQTKQEITLEIGKSVSKVLQEVLAACNELLQGLMDRLDLSLVQGKSRKKAR